jgi:hypothetical protein
VEVNYHWAPVIDGPQPGRPTLGEPELSLAGRIMFANDSSDDVLADHPFGTDVNADVYLDTPYAFFSFWPEEPAGEGPVVHTELEHRTFPRDALGFTPAIGDRVIMRGAWILDCGHPPYGAEMHPPTFAAYARNPDANTTLGMALALPYRSSQLFNPDHTFADEFDDDSRFNDGDTRTFPNALINAVLQAIATKVERLHTSALMVANRFQPLHWNVCAPLPRPAGATLDASWRFTTRTGVTVQAMADEAAGCVRFLATMGTDYVPAALQWADTDWPWDQLSSSASGQVGASIDVRQALINALGANAASAPALQPDHPPRMDAYAALTMRAGADQDTPTAIDTGADDQPFPFYGRVRVTWKK